MECDDLRAWSVPSKIPQPKHNIEVSKRAMRNAARLMYRYGLPFEKKALVTTDLSQSQSIENPAFQKRCTDELGYVPFKLLGRISPFDLEFFPQTDSLHADPLDPLDP